MKETIVIACILTIFESVLSWVSINFPLPQTSQQIRYPPLFQNLSSEVRISEILKSITKSANDTSSIFLKKQRYWLGGYG